MTAVAAEHYLLATATNFHERQLISRSARHLSTSGAGRRLIAIALESSIDSDTRQRYRQEMLRDIETHRVDFTSLGIERIRAASVPL
jgi:hypothetical protein